ncbi:Glyoxylase, beta-lactamase superfamily II [Thalassobacillus cyri]|uniref:Glyoxylase, beta-lactamase superfamily II n=1 Tax=Thalassobacillus cyri TaxID=571932 RepID=A0A1H4GEW2_9BACI|nr:MBL fold metallo-hydrolase [Thalassobacillus cyri]SEB07242.1 Glyoxylase, beta-lactamase superfamily II [Thalassobacillus cyri]
MAMKAITSEELLEKVLNKEELFIFDVRNEKDFEDWKVEGSAIEYLNIPYFELIDGVGGIVDKVPADKEIIVVCAKEGSSKMVAEMLSEEGFDTSYLAGGMKSWSEQLYKTEVYHDDDMKVFQFIRAGKGCLSYMVVSGDEALIVDPARFVDEYRAAAEQDGVKITHIVDSHLHADHISGGRQLAEMTGANYYLMKSEGAIFDFKPLENYEKIEFENVTLEVIALKTPGHTPGSVSFFVNDKLLFSGDTIFVSGLGRPDLGGKVREWAKDLYDSIYNKVSQIADDVIVLPAHYADLEEEINKDGFIGEKLGDIRSKNEVMINQSENDFVEFVAQSASSETPPNFEEIIALNRGTEKATQERQQELEIGPNRCAVHHTS